MQAVLFLARRWLHGSRARRAFTLLTSAFAILASVVICVSAFTLSPEQQADIDFGAYQQRTFDTVTVGDLRPGDVDRARSRLTTAVPGSHLLIESTQLRPDSFAKTFVQAPLTTVRFLEDPGLTGAFPGRFQLEEGSWPTKPRDVVVSQHLRDALPDPTALSVLSGRVRLRVVGVTTDEYFERADIIVAAPGTWESIQRPSTGREYQPVEAQVSVLWGPTPPIAQVAPVLERVLSPPQQVPGGRVETIRANHSTRSQVADAPISRFGSEQLVVSYVPLLLIVLLVSAFAVAHARGDHDVKMNRLLAMGMRRGHVLVPQSVALLTVAAVGIVTGLMVGWVLAVLLRSSVLPLFAPQPLSPIPAFDQATLTIAVTPLVVVVVGTLWPSRTRTAGQRSFPRLLADIQIRLVRRVLVVLLTIAALQARGGESGDLAPYLAIAAVLLTAPDLLRAALWLLPRQNLRSWVASRLTRASATGHAAAVAIIGCCLSVPACVATQLSSQELSDSTFAFSRVPANQIWVETAGGIGDVTAVGQTVARVPGVGDALVVRGLTSSRPGSQGFPAAYFLEPPGAGSSSLNTMVVDSVDDLAQVLGDELPTDAETVLGSGGVLDLTGAEGDQSFVVFEADGDRRLVTPALPTLKMSSSRQFRAQFGGVVLLSTAQKLNLPISKPNRYIFPNVSSDIIGDAAQAAVDAGYDSEFVQYAVPPPPTELPIYAYVFLAALVFGAFAVLLLVVTGLARRLRAYSSRLVAIGLSVAWTRSVLVMQVSLTMVIGLLTGALAGTVGVWVTADDYVVVEVPVLSIAVACTATIFAACLATVLGACALTAKGHLVIS